MKQYTNCQLFGHELSHLMNFFNRTPEFINEFPLAFFSEKLQRGEIQLWADPDILDAKLVAVTELAYTQAGIIATILTLAGESMDNGEECLERISIWAKRNNAVSIRAICKTPQTRLFSRYGFRPVANVIEMEV